MEKEKAEVRTMAEYIQRETLLEHAEYDNNFRLIIPAEAIKAAPAADVVPVVRCKDCKWFVDNNGGEWYGCKMFQVVRITPEDAPKPDDFCSYGERRDGGADNG